MNTYRIERPIGANAFCEEIERVCNSSQIYRRTGPKHLLVHMDAGSGRTTCIEYMTSMYKHYKILPFASGLDEYVEVSLDGSAPRKIQQGFAEFSAAAIYDNDFCNIAAVDISDVSKYMNSSQLQDFLKESKKLSETACVVFFTSSIPTQNEEKLIAKLLECVGPENVNRIYVAPYTKEELVNLAKKRLEELGIEVDGGNKFDHLLGEVFVNTEANTLKAALTVAETLVHFADFNKSVPTVDKKSVENMVSLYNRSETKGEKK